MNGTSFEDIGSDNLQANGSFKPYKNGPQVMSKRVNYRSKIFKPPAFMTTKN